MEPDYTPFDHGTQTKQEGDKFYKVEKATVQELNEEANWDAQLDAIKAGKEVIY